MNQAHSNDHTHKIPESKHQSLQLNRLIQFIQSKRTSSSNKLKQILISKDNILSDRMQHQLKSNEIGEKTVAISTKNMFVARNKTQVNSPKALGDLENKYYKIFITKEEILSLHEKQKSQFMPSGIKQFLFQLSKSAEKARSNLFPPLTLPKIKKPVVFQKYQDQTIRWLNADIKSPKQLNPEQKNNTAIQQIQQQPNKGQTKKQKVFEDIHIQRQKYNKSLQKLIEKAFKNKKNQKFILKSSQHNIIDGIQGYDSKLYVHGQTYQSDSDNNGQSIYASKGKLLSNPNLKIKKDLRFRPDKKQSPEKSITFRNGEKHIFKDNPINAFNMEYRKKIIHTNRQAEHNDTTLRIKTEVEGKAASYQATSTKTQNKTLKLISQLEQSILKNHQPQVAIIKEVNKSQHLEKTQLSSKPKQQSSSPKKRKRPYRKKPQIKTKTLQSEELKPKLRKSTNKWELSGYDWSQSTQQLQQNMQLQQYVEKMAKIQEIKDYEVEDNQ